MNQKLLLLFSLLFLGICTASAQEAPKTVYELLDVPREGCNILPKETVDSKSSKIIRRPSPPPPPPPPPPIASRPGSQQMDVNTTLSNLFKKGASAKDKTFVTHRIELSNGHYAFFDNNNWGIKDESDQVLVPPTFSYIIPDETAKGFSGYKGAKCQYYNYDGTEKVKESYYDITPTEKNTFVVRGKDGYGVIHDGQLVIQPQYKHITKARGNKSVYNVYRKDKGNTTIYWDGFKQQFTPPIRFKEYQIINDEYILLDHALVNMKTMISMFCGNNYNIEVYDSENLIFSIKKGRDKAVFLFDMKGNIITKNIFHDRPPFANENGLAIVGAQTEQFGQRGKTTVYGLIDKKGNWVVEPQYQFLRFYKGRYQAQKDGMAGRLDDKGQVLIPFDYNSLYTINDDHLLGYVKNSDKTISRCDLLDKNTGKVLKKDYIGYEMKWIEFCDKTFYEISNIQGREVELYRILDEKLKPVTEWHKRLSTTGDYIVAKTFAGRIASQRDTSFAYNCKGKVQTFKVDGKSVKEFYDMRIISDEQTYFHLLDDRRVLVDQKGKIQVLNAKAYSSSELGISGLKKLKTNQYTTILDEENQIAPVNLKDIQSFSQKTGYIQIDLDNNHTIQMDKDGQILFDGAYDQTHCLHTNAFIVTQRKKKGLVDVNNKIIIPLEYDSLSFHKGIIRANKGKESYYFDLLGNKMD